MDQGWRGTLQTHVPVVAQGLLLGEVTDDGDLVPFGSQRFHQGLEDVEVTLSGVRKYAQYFVSGGGVVEEEKWD